MCHLLLAVSISNLPEVYQEFPGLVCPQTVRICHESMSKSSRSNFDLDRQNSDSSDSSTSSWVRMLNESIGAEEISEDDTAQVSFPEPEIEATAATNDAPQTSQPLHVPGICEPCLFFWSRRWRCAKGDRCEYCHHHDFPPVGKTRPTKAVREKIQRRLYPLLQCLDAYDPSVGLVEKAWCHQRQWTENQWSNGSSWCFLVRKPVVKQQNLRRPWKQPGRRSCFVEYHVCAEGGEIEKSL